jgi:ABC-type proline/glycine betaine transport system permease subunit
VFFYALGWDFCIFNKQTIKNYMMKKIYSLLVAVLLGFSLGVTAQQSKPVGPFSVTTAATVTQMPSIQSRS